MPTNSNEAALKTITARQNSILAEADEKSAGNLTADQRREFDSLSATYAQLSKPEQSVVLPRKTPAGMSSPAEPKGSPCGWTPGRGRESGAAAGGRAAAELFNSTPHNGGFSGLGDFLHAVDRSDTQRLTGPLMAVSGASVGVPSDGGYSVPSSLAWQLLDRSLEDEIVRPRATVVPMRTAKQSYVGWSDNDHSASQIAGVSMTWVAEGDSPNIQTPKLRRIEQAAKKLMLVISASNELLTDSPEYATNLEDKFASGLGWAADKAFISGTGGGMPLGIINSTSTITVNKETGQAAATIVYENVLKAWSRLHPACHAKAVFIAHPSTMPQLATMSVTVGTGGSAVPIMSQSNGMFTIFGKPVLFTEKAANLGTVGDLILVDLSQYLIGLVDNGLRIDRSAHTLFRTDETAFRLVARVDGQPMWNAAVTPLNGSSLSWCVVLQTRS